MKEQGTSLVHRSIFLVSFIVPTPKESYSETFRTMLVNTSVFSVVFSNTKGNSGVKPVTER